MNIFIHHDNIGTNKINFFNYFSKIKSLINNKRIEVDSITPVYTKAKVS